MSNISLATSGNILDKLKKQAFTIENILTKQIAIKEIAPLITEEITLNTNKVFHGKIHSKYQPEPLSLIIRMQRGMKTTCLYISEENERPKRQTCQKELCIQKSTVVSFYDANHRQHFNSDYIYFTVEAKNDAELLITSNFGQSELRKPRELGHEPKHRILTANDIELLIKKLKSDHDALDKYNQEAKMIVKKQRCRYKEIFGQNDIITRNVKNCLVRAINTQRDFIVQHWKRNNQVRVRRNLTLDELNMKKFLSVFKVRINRILVLLIEIHRAK